MASKDGSGLTGWAILCGVPTTIAAFAAAPPLGVLALAATAAAFKAGTDLERAAKEREEAERIDRLEQECEYRGRLIAEWKLEVGMHERRWHDGELELFDFTAAIEESWAKYPKVTYPAWFMQFADAYAAWYWEGEQLLTQQLDESDTAHEDELDELWDKHGEQSAEHTARRPALRVSTTRERAVFEKEALRHYWERGMADAFRRYDEGDIDTDGLAEEILSRLPCCPS